MTTVKPGQIWADNDKRFPGRHLRVEEIDATHATVRPVTLTPQGAVAPFAGRRPTRIRLDRFVPTSTGYRLVRGVDEQPS
ncbi:hypothetical protein [Kitasatospora viridis]|uniref:Uncharacterized protein n=1 Tax=Kitasatospora viridis TaxID=281105 RepID=A0A561UKQ2_9ACTN|nr:hypothetical protein [Kitasatospora viridis]TWF99942.1 hypothetical protein FHX73_113802 [Kitasatospora viridis]